MRSTHSGIPDLLVAVPYACIQVEGCTIDLAGSKCRVAAVLHIHLASIKALGENHWPQAHAQLAFAQFLMVSILEVYLLGGKESSLVVHESKSCPMTGSEEPQGQVAGERHGGWCARESCHLLAIDSVYVKLSINTCRRRVIPGLERP